jgi:hypothetical protein
MVTKTVVAVSEAQNSVPASVTTALALHMPNTTKTTSSVIIPQSSPLANVYSQPIFSSAAIVTLLALVLATAFYLRNVFQSLMDQIIAIREGKFPKTIPPGTPQATEQLDILKGTAKSIADISTPLYWVIYLLAFRLIPY